MVARFANLGNLESSRRIGARLEGLIVSIFDQRRGLFRAVFGWGSPVALGRYFVKWKFAHLEQKLIG